MALYERIADAVEVMGLDEWLCYEWPCYVDETVDEPSESEEDL